MKLASRYEALRPAAAGMSLREELVQAGAGRELEMQARWFAGEFGREFTTLDGRRVDVVQHGVWNREAGPDFAEAAVSLDGAEPVRGAIELDMDARDWERHGHATNPAYEQVVLHVFFEPGEHAAFARTASNRAVPQVRLDLAMAMAAPPGPSPLATPGRCSGPLRELDDAALREVLEGAAQYRLQRKAARLARLREAHGDDEALYQALAETLGYKANKLPFALLSQRVPLRELKRAGANGDALLYGVAGFLKAEDMPAAAPETRAYLRGLWERWWTMRGEWERLALAPRLWNTGGQRPVNHPQRRLAALAALVRQWSRLRAVLGEPEAIRKLLAGLRDEYWERHYTVRSAPARSAMALIGSSRASDMLANVFVPWSILELPSLWSEYRKLPAELASSRVETAAARLLAGDPRAAGLLRDTPMQQGMLQIYEDFCMRDTSDCAACLFPRQVAQWRG